MKVQILLESILDQKVDAIVNAGNPRLLHGGGLCGIIYDAILKKSKKDYLEFMEEIERLNQVDGVKCMPGDAVYTKGYGLKAKFIIHTVGAIDGAHTIKDQHQILFNCYYNCFKLGKRLGVKRMAVPLVSAGLYGCQVSVVYECFKKVVEKCSELNMEVLLCMVEKDKYDEVIKLSQ